MIELRLDLRLGQKALDVSRVSGQRGGQHFEGHLTQQVLVAHAVNRSHAAGANLAHILEPPCRLSGQHLNRSGVTVGWLAAYGGIPFLQVRLAERYLFRVSAAACPLG